MLDRGYKTTNTWRGFDNNLENLANILKKNQFPNKLFLKVTKKFVSFKFDNKSFENKTAVETDTKIQIDTRCSSIAQKKIWNFVKMFCEDINVKVVLIPFNISNKFSYKDPLPLHIQSFILYKFICLNCNVGYVGKTTKHSDTVINEKL